MSNLAVFVLPAHLLAIRVDAFHDVIEGLGIDMAREASSLSSFPEPLTAFFGFVALFGVVSVLSIIAARRLTHRDVRN